jgi:serine/threonine-protein kinase
LERSEDLRRILRDLSEHEKVRPDSAPAPALSRFLIGEPLGEGASAVVYRARDRDLGRDVALKVFRGVASGEIARERFRREARAAAGLAHPNVVAVFDAGEDAGRPYLVLELVDGRPLADLLAGARPELRDLLALLEKAARGVAAAHARGIVHRDLKPANILVGRDGTPKVGDFGLAHLLDTRSDLTRTGTTLGTPRYMAPEQVEGRPDQISPRTDVYGLGAILYEALAARPPHGGETLAEVYRGILEEDPLPPSKVAPGVPRGAELIALKALEKDPSRRYADAGEFADDLRRFLDGEPVLARPAGPAARLWRRIVRHRRTVGLAALAAAAAVAAGLLGVEVLREREATRQANRELQRLAPDPRPWTKVFDGTSTACFMSKEMKAWRLDKGALVNAVPGPTPIQTLRDFGDADLRVRFRAEGPMTLGINVRITNDGGWAAEFGRGEIQALSGTEHVLVFSCRGDRISAALDGRPFQGRAHGRVLPRGTFHIWMGGGDLRIASIEVRE